LLLCLLCFNAHRLCCIGHLLSSQLTTRNSVAHCLNPPTQPLCCVSAVGPSLAQQHDWEVCVFTWCLGALCVLCVPTSSELPDKVVTPAVSKIAHTGPSHVRTGVLGFVCRQGKGVGEAGVWRGGEADGRLIGAVILSLGQDGVIANVGGEAVRRMV